MKPDTETLAAMLAQISDVDSIIVLLDTFRPLQAPSEPAQTTCSEPETLFGHYQSRTVEKASPKQHSRWTKAERAKMAELHKKGYSLNGIALQLQRTPGGVKRQIDHLEGRL